MMCLLQRRLFLVGEGWFLPVIWRLVLRPDMTFMIDLALNSKTISLLEIIVKEVLCVLLYYQTVYVCFFLTLILSTLWLTRCWRSRLLPYYRKIRSISFNPDETNFVRSIEYPTRGCSCFQLSLWHWWESMYKQCLHEGKNCSIVVALCHHAQGSAPRTLNNSPQVCVIVCQPSVSTGFTRSRLLENSDPHTLGDLERSLN